MKGIVHHEFVPPNTMVNSDFYSYCDILRRLRENARQKGPELWRNHNWLLHHDNAPAHTSLKTTEFVTNNNMVIIPPILTSLSPLWFRFVSQIENETEGTTFWNSVLTSKGNGKWYSTALRKMTSTVLLKRGKNDGIAVWVSVPKETILKEMAATSHVCKTVHFPCRTINLLQFTCTFCF
jgi:hypothetical protein